MIYGFFWVLGREFLYIIKNTTLRNIVFLAPLVYAILMANVYKNNTIYDMPVAILQEDFSASARTLARMIEASPKMTVKYQVQSIEEIKHLMNQKKVLSGIVIPQDFSQRLKQGKDVPITTYVDSASMVSANMLSSALNQVVQTFSAGVEIKTLMKKGESLKDAKERMMPVKLDLRPLNNPSFNYTNFLVPGLFITILQQVALLAMAISWSGEQETGTINRLFDKVQNPFSLMFGKAIPYILVNFAVAEFYFRVLFPMFNIPIEGNWQITILFSFMFICTIVFWGMWFSAFCSKRIVATQILMFIALPSFVLSGFTWPLFAMPEYIQYISKLLPITYFVNGFRNIYLGGISFEYIYGEFQALGIFLVINIIGSFIGVKYLLYKYHKEKKDSLETN